MEMCTFIWSEYDRGFGNMNGEFWLGLGKIHELTYSRRYELHVILEDWDGVRAVARYSDFLVAGPEEGFMLRSLGNFSGSAGDSLRNHLGMKFTTFDVDNDERVQLIHPQPGFRDPFEVFCDQEYEGGGWIVVQNRYDGSVHFYRGWNDYERGFGDLEGEMWLGLGKIHELTYSRRYELHVILEDWDGVRAIDRYSSFLVAGPEEGYMLRNLGNFSGSAGDSLTNYDLDMAEMAEERKERQKSTENSQIELLVRLLQQQNEHLTMKLQRLEDHYTNLTNVRQEQKEDSIISYFK
ncbi:hypothetical protein pipiens_004632 [Culex pipiens pipiens]|uniref:Fibrinogen C-terminal domain-containing protein n=1 Tax=Culex pipiens pipiens TaxID=38569 RepID=A0ABD1CGR0_CULPP